MSASERGAARGPLRPGRRQYLGAGLWPLFPIAAWGIGLVMNAWDVYWRREITEHDIQHEMERADRHG